MFIFNEIFLLSFLQLLRITLNSTIKSILTLKFSFKISCIYLFEYDMYMKKMTTVPYIFILLRTIMF